MLPLLPLLTVAVAGALLLSACQSSCSKQPTPEAVQACNDQNFQNFQQQLRDNRPAGR